MNWRRACIWSSWTLLPMAAVLALKGSLRALLYATASVVAFAYHWHEQHRWSLADHGLAWACIAANLWLAGHCPWQAVVAASFAVSIALLHYAEAHKRQYDKYHTHWHIWCGITGVLLAGGYTP